MVDGTSAVLRWRARSDTVGTPRGRFSVFPGLGIYTRRMFGTLYPCRWMDSSMGPIHSLKVSFAPSTVWPSTPTAERFGIRPTPWLHAGGKNPGSTSIHSRYRELRFCLPLSGIGLARPVGLLE